MSRESTSPDLVELTRALYGAGNRRDIDAVLRFHAPDAVYKIVGLGSHFEGTTAIRGFLEDWTGTYEEFRIELEDVRDLGNGVTFAVLLQSGRPVGSSGLVQLRLGVACVWEDGRVIHTTHNADLDEARAGAEGLARERSG